MNQKQTTQSTERSPLKKTSGIQVYQLVQMSILAALSIALVYLLRFPIFPSASFLEYDPADIALFLGTLLYGPAAGLILTAVVCVIQGLTVSAVAGPIGILMHFAATGSFVLVAGLMTRKNKSVLRVLLALAAGVATMCATMILWNILITPLYMGVPRAAIIEMILPVFLPFNLIKAGVNSALAFAVYKTVGRFLTRRA